MISQDSPECRERDIRSLQTFGIKELQVEITTRCNFRCSKCSRRKGGNDMHGGLAEAVLARLPAFSSMTLSGRGEALLAGRALAFVQEAKKNRLFVRVLTNASLMDEGLAAALIDAGLDEVGVSMDAAGRSPYRELCGADEFDRSVANVRAMVDARRRRGAAKPKVGLGIVMSRRNAGEWPAVVRLAGEIGADRVALWNLVPNRPEDLEDVLYSFPGRDLPEDLRRVRDDRLREAHDAGKKLGIPVHATGFDFPEARVENCGHLRGTLFVSAEGDVGVCPSHMASPGAKRLGRGGLVEAPPPCVFGNLHRETFADILNSGAYGAHRSSVGEGRVPGFCCGCISAHGLC